MKRFVSVFSTILLLLVQLCTAQEVQQHATPTGQSSAPAQTPAAQTPKLAPSKPTLEDGTPVKLRINQTVSSADAHVGQTVDFEVLEEVKVGETLVIPKGGVAL